MFAKYNFTGKLTGFANISWRLYRVNYEKSQFQRHSCPYLRPIARLSDTIIQRYKSMEVIIGF